MADLKNEKIDIQVDRMYRFDNGGQLKAFCDVCYHGLSIKGYRVCEGKKGLFVSAPAEIGKDGCWYNTVVPTTAEIKEAIERAILEAYNEK